MVKKVVHPTGGGKLTQQHMAEAMDPNKIMERYNATGVLRSAKPNGRQPMFIRMSGDSFHEMLVKVQEIQGQFSALPARVRKRFAHNPQNLLMFLEDDKNLAEAIELGLIDESNLPKEKRAQLDLVDESQEQDYREFQEWKKRKDAPQAGGEDDPPPQRADDEAQPSYRRGGTPRKGGKGGRTS